MDDVNRKADAIGVFDSGVGGLSVLRELLRELPYERFVYLADQGHAPYGERSDAHVVQRAHLIAQHLVNKHGIKALVVACNTATAAAIHLLREAHPGLPIVGIEPALKPAVSLSQTRRIGVMATRSTLQSEKFRVLAGSMRGQAEFVLQACDGLADAIERDDAMKIGAICAHYTGALGLFGTERGQIDTLVLGCTHYPFAIRTLKALVGNTIALLEGGAPVARQTRRLLAEQQWLSDSAPSGSTSQSRVVFGSTADPAALQAAVGRWLERADTVASCNI